MVRVRPAERNEPPRDARVKSEITGVKFNNSHLEVWLNTSANKYRDDDLFYGGAVTSVILEKEAFEPYTTRLEASMRCGRAPAILRIPKRELCRSIEFTW